MTSANNRAAWAATAQDAELSAELKRTLARDWLPPQWARPIWRIDELPNAVAAMVRSLPPTTVWRAYTDEHSRLWLGVAVADLTVGDTQRAITVEVRLFDAHGRDCSEEHPSPDVRPGWL